MAARAQAEGASVESLGTGPVVDATTSGAPCCEPAACHHAAMSPQDISHGCWRCAH